MEDGTRGVRRNAAAVPARHSGRVSARSPPRRPGAALSTGALPFIDYDVVAKLSHIYQVQTFYSDSINRIIAAVTATPAFEPASRSLVARQLGVDMQNLISAQETQMEAYRRNLPAIQKAAAEMR